MVTGGQLLRTELYSQDIGTKCLISGIKRVFSFISNFR